MDKGWTFDWSMIKEPVQKTSDFSCPDLIPEISEGYVLQCLLMMG